jgi:hypothetical protein
MLELLAFDKKYIFDLFCFICGDKASVALPPENKATSKFSYSFKKLNQVFWLVVKKWSPWHVGESGAHGTC